MCLMCADTSEVLVGLKTHKYRPKAFQRCPEELRKTKSRSYRSLQVFGENEKISSKFSNLENWWFSLKITQLCGEPQERGFVAQSSWGHHSKGFCPYFQVFKPPSTTEVSAHTRHTICISKKFNINFFPLSQHIAKLLKKYCIKTFSIILILFFSKTPEKVRFLEKKVRPNPTHTALCGGVPNSTSWEQVLEKKKRIL